MNIDFFLINIDHCELCQMVWVHRLSLHKSKDFYGRYLVFGRDRSLIYRESLGFCGNVWEKVGSSSIFSAFYSVKIVLWRASRIILVGKKLVCADWPTTRNSHALFGPNWRNGRNRGKWFELSSAFYYKLWEEWCLRWIAPMGQKKIILKNYGLRWLHRSM